MSCGNQNALSLPVSEWPQENSSQNKQASVKVAISRVSRSILVQSQKPFLPCHFLHLPSPLQLLLLPLLHTHCTLPSFPSLSSIPLLPLPPRYALKLLNSVSTLSPSLSLSWTDEELTTLQGLVEREWWKVALFFMLRAAMAPCVETLILLDRKLYLLEQGE